MPVRAERSGELGHVPFIDVVEPPAVLLLQGPGADLFVAQVQDSFGPLVSEDGGVLPNTLRIIRIFAMIRKRFFEKELKFTDKNKPSGPSGSVPTAVSQRSALASPPGARALALDILAAAARSGQSVEDHLAAAAKRHPGLPRRERALLLELVQG